MCEKRLFFNVILLENTLIFWDFLCKAKTLSNATHAQLTRKL